MRYSLIWLPEVLEKAGLKVATVDGWEERGRDEMGQVRGVLCHHTAGPRAGNMPSLGTLINGRSDLPGPLSQLGLGRDGTYYVIGAGRCNHAGQGIWQGVVTGNSSFIGIEAENTGRDDDPWPAIQMQAYRQGVAAILAHIGQGETFCAGHKEYATPAGRKPDPSFDMLTFRQAVAAILQNGGPLTPIPDKEPGERRRQTLRRGSTGALAREIRRELGLPPGDLFDAQTEAAVRAFQRSVSLVPDGIVGPKTWAQIDNRNAEKGAGMICRRIIQNAAAGTYVLRVTVSGTAAVAGRRDSNGVVVETWVHANLVPGPRTFAVTAAEIVRATVIATFGKPADTAKIELLKDGAVLKTCDLQGATTTSVMSIIPP